MMKTNKFATARKFAKRLINKYELMPPVDVRKLFADMNIDIEEKSNQYGIEAYSYLNGSVKVVLNTEITFPPRVRFTLAHEMGHICIPWHNGDTKCVTDNSYVLISSKRFLDTQELEANIFASELLMPTEWVKNCIANNKNSLEQLIIYMKNTASTSTMACFFALENAFTSGNIIFVKKNLEDFWRVFKSANTYATKLYYLKEDEFNFLNLICEEKEQFSISQYEVIYYKLLPCQSNENIKKLYESNNNNLVQLLNCLTDYSPIKSIPFLKNIIKAIPNKYVVYIIYKFKVLSLIRLEDSGIKLNSSDLNYNELLEIISMNNFLYEDIKLDGDYMLITVKEMIFDMPSCKNCNPNYLLKQIVGEIYFEDTNKQLMRINAIVSGINSVYKEVTRERLYHLVKCRFYGDKNYIEFYNHYLFETYIVNKVDKMIAMRK